MGTFASTQNPHVFTPPGGRFQDFGSASVGLPWRFQSASKALRCVCERFRVDSRALPKRFHASGNASGALPRVWECFRKPSVMLPHRFRKASTLVPHCFRETLTPSALTLDPSAAFSHLCRGLPKTFYFALFKFTTRRAAEGFPLSHHFAALSSQLRSCPRALQPLAALLDAKTAPISSQYLSTRATKLNQQLAPV